MYLHYRGIAIEYSGSSFGVSLHGTKDAPLELWSVVGPLYILRRIRRKTFQIACTAGSYLTLILQVAMMPMMQIGIIQYPAEAHPCTS